MIRQHKVISSLDTVQRSTREIFEWSTWLEAVYEYQSSYYPPICIVDNHNLVLPFWWKWTQWFPSWLPCLHIDQHADLSEPDRLPSSPRTSLDDVEAYTSQYTWIASFIVPAVKQGVLSECIQIRSEYMLYEQMMRLPSQYILDIDVDFWSMSSESEIKKHCIDLQPALLWATCITIATSPAFIDQDHAVRIVKQLLSQS